LGRIYDFFKCEKCGKELHSTVEQKHVLDRQGLTHVYCCDCYKEVEKP